MTNRNYEFSIFTESGRSMQNRYERKAFRPRLQFLCSYAIKCSDLLVVVFSLIHRFLVPDRDTEPFKRMGYSQYFPPTDFYANQFNSCALVSSAGSMLGSKLGPEIGEDEPSYHRALVWL